MNVLVLIVIIGTACIGYSYEAPSLVLTSVSDSIKGDLKYKVVANKSLTIPIIYEFSIKSNITNCFATTLVTSKVKNAETTSREATFTVVLPEKAFISGFIMEIKGQSYKAYVKEKEEAKKIYESAVQRGENAGHVAVSARDSNKFTVSVNIEPESKVTFLLTYEELLERKNNQYELVLNVHPGQIVKLMNIEVLINESRALTFVKTPPLRSGNEISNNDEILKPSSLINIINSNSSVVRFKPTIEDQKKFIKGLGGHENKGLSGQFVVQYDVERDPHGGEVLLRDGYFVHFFAPDDLEALPKHVVFVLDTSGSMYGDKIRQLREAMISILGQLKDTDLFHIIDFNTDVYVWNIDTGKRTTVKIHNDEAPFEELRKIELPPAVPATKEFISKGKEVIKKLQDDDMTNIMSSISTALHVIRQTQTKNSQNKQNHQPLIMFLTDGEPTVGIDLQGEIINITSRLNTGESKVPIYSLSFGDGADKNFLRKLSLTNLGFSRHIYEAADATLQLQGFYQQISSPLLSHVHFKYDSAVKNVSRIDFPIFFKGSEVVVAGRYEGGDVLDCIIDAIGPNGTTLLKPSIKTPASSLERLWAYLTVKQKLEQRETVENKTQLTKEALDLALKYSFVTDVSSLVVVKPNGTSAVDTIDASKTDAVFYNPDRGLGIRFGDMDDDFGADFMSAPALPADPYTTEIIETSGIEYISANITENAGISDWRDDIPWLKSSMHSNGTLSIANGTYIVTDDSKFLPKDDCPSTPFNSTEHGLCSSLYGCYQSYPLLTDFQTYEKYFCIFEKIYAGVCCPRKYLPFDL